MREKVPPKGSAALVAGAHVRFVRMVTALVLLCAILAAGGAHSAEGGAQEARRCGTRCDPQQNSALNGLGGIYLTSRGTLRVLIVFASFPDDLAPHPFWPARQAPTFLQQFIDPDTTTNSPYNYNLTNYFRQMSLGRFRVVGQAVWVEAPRPSTEYFGDNNFGVANRHLLRDVAIPRFDFSPYDQWTRDADFVHRNVPDSVVDMIVMVWRGLYLNIEGNRFLGEASLGRLLPLLANNGRQIHMGFPGYAGGEPGSGVTCQYPYTQQPSQVLQTMAHEVGHWLLGGLHPYGAGTTGKHAFWSILGGGEVAASCANAYERERLNWISVPEIPAGTDLPLPDYVVTGAAYKYHPPNGNAFEYYYIENHQKLSVFDDATRNPDDRGVWLLHQRGPYAELDNLRIMPSDGNWVWVSPGTTTRCFAQELPRFRCTVPRITGGQTHRDQIPLPANAWSWMYVRENPGGEVRCGAFFAGEQSSGAFNSTTSSVFSSYSNPASSTWENQPTRFSLEIINDAQGIVTIRRNAQELDGAPARRHLGPDPSPGRTPHDSVALAWGTQWPEGQLLEADVNWSELQRKVGHDGEWNVAYEGPATGWRDGSVRYDTSGTVPVFFRVRVRDTQGKYSTWSGVYHTAMIPANSVEEYPAECPARFGFDACYPNPFNPATTINYELSTINHATLKVHDLLGREIATLVNEVKQPGTYTARWDAAGVPSGVYFATLRSGGLSATTKVVVLR